MKSYEDVRAEVQKRKGVMHVPMGVLRDIQGVAKLGSTNRPIIRRRLERLGLAVDVDELPKNQHDLVRVYDPESPIGRVIDAVFGSGEDADRVLRTHVAADALEKIEKVREIVS